MIPEEFASPLLAQAQAMLHTICGVGEKSQKSHGLSSN